VTFIDWRDDGGPHAYSFGLRSGLGYSHELCISPSGAVHNIPAGGTHLLEHALMRVSGAARKALPGSLGSHISANVFAECTTWTTRRFTARRPHAVSTTATHLLSCLSPDADEATWETALADEARVVAAERLHRHGELHYRLHVALAGAIAGGFRGRDPLDLEPPPDDRWAPALRAALATLKNAVHQLTIVGPTDDRVIDEVLTTLAAAPELGAREEWTPVDMIEHRAGPLNVSQDDARRGSADAYEALLCLRLRGLCGRFADAETRARQLAVREMLNGWAFQWHPSSLLETFITLIFVPNAWLDEVDVKRAIRLYRQRIYREIMWMRQDLDRAHEHLLAGTLSTVDGFRGLAIRAEASGVPIEDLIDALLHIGPRDFELFHDDIASADAAVAYEGPALG
jgi:hypothetical protein